MSSAVACGYWPLYRYNPQVTQALTLDSPDPVAADFEPFLSGEDRYADLRLVDPSDAPALQSALQRRCVKIHDILAAAAKSAGS